MDRDDLARRRERLYTLLREARVDAGLRQVDLAERLQEPQSFVSKYENGERRLGFVEVAEICRALGISFVDFARRYASSGE